MSVSGTGTQLQGGADVAPLLGHAVDGCSSLAPPQASRLQPHPPPDLRRVRQGPAPRGAPRGAGPWPARPEDAPMLAPRDSARAAGGERPEGAAEPAQPRAATRAAAAGSGRSKLVLHYAEGENPMSELLRLGGGQGMDVIVEAVSEHGKAARAGVKPGFALVTLNGRSEFAQLPGWQVRLLLDAPPITMGFDPDPVKPQSMKCTEIRLTRAQEILGIPPRAAVCDPRERSFLAEEVVFKPGSAPLWLSAWGDEAIGKLSDGPATAKKPAAPCVYELRRPEAHAIVGHAIRGARALSPDLAQREAKEAAWIAAAARQAHASPWRCGEDCVSECVGDGGDIVVHPRGHAAAPILPAIGTSGGAASSTSVGASTAEDRSPMRWLGPLLGGFMGSPRTGGASPSGAFGPRAGSPRGAKVEDGAFAFGVGRPPGALSWAAVSGPDLFAGDDGVAGEAEASPPARLAAPVTPPRAPWIGEETRLSDIYASEVGSCQI